MACLDRSLLLCGRCLRSHVLVASFKIHLFGTKINYWWLLNKTSIGIDWCIIIWVLINNFVIIVLSHFLVSHYHLEILFILVNLSNFIINRISFFLIELWQFLYLAITWSLSQIQGNIKSIITCFGVVLCIIDHDAISALSFWKFSSWLQFIRGWIFLFLLNLLQRELQIVVQFLTVVCLR